MHASILIINKRSNLFCCGIHLSDAMLRWCLAHIRDWAERPSMRCLISTLFLLTYYYRLCRQNAPQTCHFHARCMPLILTFQAGLDAPQCRAVLTELAKFHALSLAMRAQQPDEFARDVTGCVREALFVPENEVTTECSSCARKIHRAPLIVYS